MSGGWYIEPLDQNDSVIALILGMVQKTLAKDTIKQNKILLMEFEKGF